jgi:hypothetical protein
MLFFVINSLASELDDHELLRNERHILTKNFLIFVNIFFGKQILKHIFEGYMSIIKTLDTNRDVRFSLMKNLYPKLPFSQIMEDVLILPEQKSQCRISDKKRQ